MIDTQFQVYFIMSITKQFLSYAPWVASLHQVLSSMYLHSCHSKLIRIACTLCISLSVFVCLCVHVCMVAFTCACVCGGQRSAFIKYLPNCSPPYFLKPGLLLTQKLTNSARVSGLQGPWILSPYHLTALGLYSGVSRTSLLHRAGEQNLMLAQQTHYPLSQPSTFSDKELELRGLWELAVGHSTNKQTSTVCGKLTK